MEKAKINFLTSLILKKSKKNNSPQLLEYCYIYIYIYIYI